MDVSGLRRQRVASFGLAFATAVIGLLLLIAVGLVLSMAFGIPATD